MKIYHFKRQQSLPLGTNEAWEFFSVPGNLAKITPRHLRFKILYVSGSDGIYAGQIIRYRIHIPPGIPMQWVTEITHVNKPFHFIDEQRSGPYALWHHQHHFREVQGGVEMIDELTYAIPLGWIGRLAHWLFVAREVNAIFEYRRQVLNEMFRTVKKKTDHEY